jgi:hypothetical protein
MTVIVRYQTLGRAYVEIDELYRCRCTGCGQDDAADRYANGWGTSLSGARAWAQSHADTCRLSPTTARPHVTPQDTPTTEPRDARQIAWDSIRALRDAAARLQLDHQDPTAEELFVRADALADALRPPTPDQKPHWQGCARVNGRPLVHSRMRAGPTGVPPNPAR